MEKLLKSLTRPTREWAKKILSEYELDSHHARLLILAGQAWDRIQEAREVIKKHGATYVDRFDCPHSRPEVATERDSRIAFARLLRELNLDGEASEDLRPPALKY